MEFTEEKIGELGQLYCGDCLNVLKILPSNHVTGICTDPPAGIFFMGKNWDSNKGGRDQWIEWLTVVMGECLRIIKPGGMVLVWSIPRTSHWTATAIENAGFTIKEKIYHIFGSGFPKSLSIGKAVDKLQGNEREFVWADRYHDGGERKQKGMRHHKHNVRVGATANTNYTTKGTSEWEGYGTATKPAVEEWILAMKPIDGTFAENAIVHGLAGINIDGSRINSNEDCARKPSKLKKDAIGYVRQDEPEFGGRGHSRGRWPSNLVLQHSPDCVKIGEKKVKGAKSQKPFEFPIDNNIRFNASKIITRNQHADQNGNETIEEYKCHKECPIFQLNQQAGVKKSGTNCIRTKEGFFLEHGGMGKAGDKQITYGDEGHVSRYFLNLPPDTNRFFYSAKASRSERSKGCENLPEHIAGGMSGTADKKLKTGSGNERNNKASNFHPTVKSLSLIKYLCTLLKQPQNTLILDLFAGSGTMGVACEQLKIPYILIEKEPEYCDIIRARVKAANQPDKPTKRKPIVKPTNTLFDWNEINTETT